MKRFLTICFLLPLALGSIFYLPLHGWSALVAAFVGLAAWEHGELSGLRALQSKALFVLLLLLSMLALHFSLTVRGYYLWMAFGMMFWGLALAKCLLYDGKHPDWAVTWWRLLCGVLLFVPAWASLVVLKNLEDGALWTLACFCLVWATDVGGFLVGKTLGRHRLAPALSPNKTWEGALGSLTGVLLTAVVFANLLPALSIVQWLLLAVLTGAFAVLGDLFESLLKRVEGVKDSGSLLPGHGGIFDRIDSICAAAPAFTIATLWWLNQWIVTA